MRDSSKPGSPPPMLLQTRMVLLSYCAYFFYYFCRKHLGVATSTLLNQGFSESMIGWVQTAYGVCYAVGQFFSGALGDRFGPRIALTLGMVLSGIATLAFGIFPFMGVMAVMLSLNGVFQSTGWSNACKVVSAWVASENRGRVMGGWTTCYVFGSMAANVFIAWILQDFGWREVFLTTGIVVMVVGVMQGLFLINRPEDLGYSHGGQDDAPESQADGVEQGGFVKMLKEPSIWLLGLTYMGLKYVRYAVFAWMPYYLESVTRIGKVGAASASNGLEAGGVLGLALGGWLADRYFRLNRVRLAMWALLGMIIAVLIYRQIRSCLKTSE